MDIERTMQFIVDNLAAVTVRQEQTEERLVALLARQEKTEALHVKADGRLTRLERQLGGLQKLVKIGMRMIADVSSAQKRTEKALADLAIQHKRTDEKFERWLDSMNKGANGHKKRLS